MLIDEGYMPFIGYQTWYRIVGKKNAHKKPLLLLHGGPGSTHNYFEVLDKLAVQDERQLVMYDQIGCGESYVENRPDLWHMDTWIAELVALRQHLQLDGIHLLGQSWGGMLALEYLCNHTATGVASIVLSSTHPASWMWQQEQQRLVNYLPVAMRQAIEKAASTGDYTHADYIAAETEYMLRHAVGEVTEQTPECVRRPAKKGRQSYLVAWGPNEFTASGTLRDYDVTTRLADIKQPTLIVSGGDDLCTPYIAKYMYDNIPDARWELFRHCRHSCFVEHNDKYITLMQQWLNNYD